MSLLRRCAAVVLMGTLASTALAQRLEIGGPNAPAAAIRIESDRIDAQVEEGVARVTVDETFRNTTDRVLEGVYTFRLPEDAVVGAFSMWMGGVEKHGRVLEAQQARRTYDAIVRKQRDPGLLEEVGWREFRVSVYPVPKRDTVRIRLEYAHPLRDDLALQTLELPLPTRDGAIGDLRVHVSVAAAHGVVGLDCPSHPQAKLVVEGNMADASWSGDGVTPTGPFVVRAIPRRDGFDVALLADRPSDAASGWFIARIVPKLAAPPRIPRDVAFVIDRSGSMNGKKIEQARAALLAGLDTLKPGDRFDVISFSSDVTSLGEGRWIDVNEENLARARRAARDISASGGTNIAGALQAATRARDGTGGRLAAVVFLTDGDPTVGETDPNRILAAWRQESAGARLFAFGVGNDVKDFLLTKLAVEGRGDARYVREDDDLEVPLAALFERLKTPLLVDPVVEVDAAPDDGPGVEILDREPRRLPDLFQGRTLMVCGRYTGSGKAVLRLRGKSGGESIAVDVPVEFPKTTPRRDHVAQIWARTRVERLLDDLRVGGANAEIRAEVLALGLAHQLVTPYTSFLVVEDDPKLATAGVPTGERREVEDGTDFGRMPTGPSTLRGAGDTTPPGNPSGPATGGPPAPPSGGGGGIRGAGGGLTKRSSGEGFERWEFWWEHNKDPFVAAAAEAAEAAKEAGAGRASGAAVVSAEVVDALLAGLADPDPDLADSAALALARAVRGDDPDGRVRAALTKALAHPAKSAREAATVALGVLGEKEAVAPLRELLHDTEEGRKLTNLPDGVEPMVRAFAAAALGLLHAQDAVPDLEDAVVDSNSSNLDVKGLSVLALGMMHERHDEIVGFLVGLMQDRSLNNLVRAQAPIALGRLKRATGERSLAVHAVLEPKLLPLFQDDKIDHDLRRSLAICIGKVATIEDPTSIEALMEAASAAKDDQTRHWSILALAEIGARDADPAKHPDAHAKLKEFFVRELGGARHITHLPYAALALAMWARNPAQPDAVRAAAAAALAASFDATTNPSYEGALAVGLGLLGAKASADDLWKKYDASNDQPMKGYVAVALALMGARDHARELREELSKKGLDAKFRLELALGLGVRGDAAATKPLLGLLERGETIAESATAARALGLARDPAALAPLLALARDATRPPLQRAFAEAALGLLLSKERVPWTAAFSNGSNYRAKVAALSEILDLM